MLVCYLDDSGENKEPVLTMAGLLGSVHGWLDFERQGRILFDEVGIRYLHTVELHHRRGEFEGWNSAETAEFAHALFRIVERYALFGVEFSVLKSRFNEGKIKYRLKRESSALSMCFRGILDRIVKDENFFNIGKITGSNLSFVVESGNKNNQDVLQRFDAIRRMDPNRFGSLVFQDKRKLVALQAADFIAFYSRRIRNRTPGNWCESELKMFQRTLGSMKHKPFFATNFYA